MQEIDITPRWYSHTHDEVMREARRAVLCDVTSYWRSEKSKFGDGHKEHRAAGMRVDIGERRVLATMPGDASSFPAFCAAMLDRLSVDKVQRLAAGRARLLRGEGTRTEHVMIGGAGPESNLPAVEIADPSTGQFLVDVQCGNDQSRRFWSSHAGI